MNYEYVSGVRVTDILKHSINAMASDGEKTKSITLQTSWKQYFLPYLLSVLAIPLFGIGLIVLYFLRRKHLGMQFEVTDTRISQPGTETGRAVDLVDIEEITVRKNWLQDRLGIGTLVLKTSASEMELPGMRRPEQLKSTIEKAAALQQRQAEKKSYRERPDPDYKPGSMEKMDYLTGLWQQGLLSDEDFDREKRNFE